MKFATVSKSLVLGLAVVLASSAFAATKATLNLQGPATVNGTQLKAGEYKVQWEGNGPNVEVSILKGKNVVAKVPAKLVDLNAASQNDVALVKTGDDGSRSLAGARFQGKKVALEIGESTDTMQSGSSR